MDLKIHFTKLLSDADCRWSLQNLTNDEPAIWRLTQSKFVDWSSYQPAIRAHRTKSVAFVGLNDKVYKLHRRRTLMTMHGYRTASTQLRPFPKGKYENSEHHDYDKRLVSVVSLNLQRTTTDWIQIHFTTLHATFLLFWTSTKVNLPVWYPSLDDKSRLACAELWCLTPSYVGVCVRQ